MILGAGDISAQTSGMSKEFWETAAQRDPLWAILSDPTKKGRQWDLPAFFVTGRREISLLLYQLRRLGHLPSTTRALDFGCGVGRLTQALALTFDEVVGVDVSPTMLRLGDRLNAAGRRVRYVLNDSLSLDQFASGVFDFVYSDLVLQHLPPSAALTYITEFLRVLAPGGVVVFQLPSRKRRVEEAVVRTVSMPNDAYVMSVKAAHGLPERMRVDERIDVLLEITNRSHLAWVQQAVGPIRVGNHWRSPAGEMLIQDDGRAPLPLQISPDETILATVPIQVPPEAGRYTCEFDLVHEGISWFADLGAAPLQCPTIVLEPHLLATADAAIVQRDIDESPERWSLTDIYEDLPPGELGDIREFPMYGVHQDLVRQSIVEAGGQLFHLEKDERCGPEWEGF